MKTTILMSLLCLSAMGSYAQSQDAQTTERQMIKERANAIYQRTHGNMGHRTRMHYKSNYSDVHAAYPDAPANAVPAWPSTTSDYTVLQDPPCYKYKNNRGLEVMECPGARFAPENRLNTEPEINVYENTNNLTVSREKSYTGNYPNLHSLYPQAPRNAVPAWPSSPYTELQNPPCYQYTNKRGLKVMECPGAQFEPEHVYR